MRAYYQMPPMSQQDKERLSDSVEFLYPLATELNPPSATFDYNCHGYAWHVSEGGSYRWIGCYPWEKEDEDEYWKDASYIKLKNESEATKISYWKDNHSAIQTSTQGVYISKWGAWPLMRHARDYGPEEYQMDYRNYYTAPVMSGNSLCVLP